MAWCLVKHRNNFTFTLITPWCRIFFEQLIVAQLVKQRPILFMEPEGSLPRHSDLYSGVARFEFRPNIDSLDEILHSFTQYLQDKATLSYMSIAALDKSFRNTIWSIWQHTDGQQITLRTILILSSNLLLGLPSGLFPLGLPTKKLSRNAYYKGVFLYLSICVLIYFRYIPIIAKFATLEISQFIYLNDVCRYILNASNLFKIKVPDTK
jgi:hypothetical protein